MRDCLTVLALCLAANLAGAADEAAAKLAAQKKAAKAAWDLLEIGEPAMLQTTHLLSCGPTGQAKRLNAVGVLLGKYHATAIKALGLTPKDAYPWKITVYLLASKQQLASFARRVEKRRPLSGETGSLSADDD